MADIKILDLTTATEITETTDYIPVVDTSIFMSAIFTHHLF